MPINARCPICGGEFRRPDSLAGKREKCPECRTVFVLPAAALPKTTQARTPQHDAPVAVQQSPAPAAPVADTKEEAPESVLPPVHSPDQPPTPIIEVSEVAAGKEVSEVDFFDEVLETEPLADVSEVEPVDEVSEVEPVPLVAEQVESLEVEPVSEAPEGPPARVDFDESDIFALTESEGSKQQAAPLVPTPTDYIALAASAACEGQSAEQIGDELFEQGMDETEADEVAEFMTAAFEGYGPSKGTTWFRVLGGLLLIILNATGLVIYGNQSSTHNSPIMQYVTLAFTLIGLFLFLSGLWRLIHRQGVPAKELIRAWQDQSSRR